MKKSFIFFVFFIVSFVFCGISQNNEERPVFSMYKNDNKGDEYNVIHTNSNEKREKMSMYKSAYPVPGSDNTATNQANDEKEKYSNLRKNKKSEGSK